ncbi:caspase, EACC1-associated type [Streptomyces sp. NPDC002851]
MSGRTSRPDLPELPTGPRSALVVTVSSYADAGLARLRAPARDAEALAEVLGSPDIGGFDVRGLTDPTAQEIRGGVDDFLAGRGTDELLLVYFSCHGLLDARGRLYFAGADTRKDRLASSGVEAGWLLEQLDECRARRQVVVLDCCFSGAFAQGAKADDQDVNLGHRLVGHGRGRAVLTASRSREYSFEGESLTGAAGAPSGSVFTTGLVDGLRTGAADRDGDGYISVEDAFDHAAAYVAERGAEQTPQRWVYGAEGRIWLARTAVPAAAEPDLPEAVRVALDSPLPAVRIGGVTVLGEWLSDGDIGRARLAQRHLKRIAGSDIPTVAQAARALLPSPVAPPPAETKSTPAPSPAPAPAPAPAKAKTVPSPPPVPARSRGKAGPVPPPRSASTRAKAATVPGLLHALPVWETSGSTAQERWLTAMAVHPTAPLVATAVDGGQPQLWAPVEGRLLHTLHGHDDAVRALALSPYGSLLATSSYDGTVRLWDTQNGRHLNTLRSELGLFSERLTIAPDGRLLATDDLDCTVQVWESPTGRPVLRVDKDTQGHNPFVTALAFSPGGHTLAVGTDAGVVRVLDIGSGKQLVRSKCHDGWANHFAFSPDGRWLASASSANSSVLLWDTQKWRRKPRRIQVDELGADRVVFSPDGSLLAVGNGLDVRLLRPDTGQHLATLGEDLGNATDVFDFSHDGARLAAVGTLGEVSVWDTWTGRQLHRLTGGHGIKAGHVGFTPNDRHLVTGGDDGVYVWQLR